MKFEVAVAVVVEIRDQESVICDQFKPITVHYFLITDITLWTLDVNLWTDFPVGR